jgi:hypothetical protein
MPHVLHASVYVWDVPLAATQTLRIPKAFHVGPMPNGRGSFFFFSNHEGSEVELTLGCLFIH